MTLDCTCNRLKEAERKAALWDGIVAAFSKLLKDTNYDLLFGTPKDAAFMLAASCACCTNRNTENCVLCCVRPICFDGVDVLAWLESRRGDA